MENWKLDLKSEVIKSAYERYLERLDAISTIYSVVSYTDDKLKKGEGFIGSSERIRLSDDFDDVYTTIKTKDDIERSSSSGTLHQINCSQAIIAILANFENLVEEYCSIFSVPGSVLRDTKVNTLQGEINNSSVLKKFTAIHKHLNIDSNAINVREMTIYYKYTLIRNRLVHQQGSLKDGDYPLLEPWALDGVLHFDGDAIDSIIHFFLMPLTSFVKALDYTYTSRCT
ncbi:TPA: hypothetical protein ACF5BV_004710 [Vibrio parahaemolyticus]|uniref:hypothetical protein n=1 Tax=Vibrio parahaemolyticus TaxID=670 RepID=UPI001A21696C|nr:hypothetical protein [Vibrio parahaemolyticus]EGR0400020.1 hypothetical protein [Vibrio parahaemolyticus]MCI9720663.1 hypothetical protein [Vibrio parahaemolyticus]HAS6434559.1 hypothetical protein [Vibrio parahaemolyticus]HAS6854036.1 hypothetical protein [Vibrio parahaemolyticus]HAS6962226.1 hypothetical protein [Vibrio parahaemolyticus]